jgi:hypothetical protein
MRQRRLERCERRVRRQRHLHRANARHRQLVVSFEEVDGIRGGFRGVSQRRFDRGEIEKVLTALRQVDVEQRDERQAHEDLQMVRRRTDEHLHEDIARHVVSADPRRLQDDHDCRRRNDDVGAATAAQQRSNAQHRTLRERNDRVRAESFVQEPLNTFSLVRLGDIQVPLRIDSQAVRTVELSRKVSA